MRHIVKKSIEELNELLPKEKKLEIKDTTSLIGDKSSLESIDLVNLFVSLEKNLKSEKNLNLTFDELLNDLKNLKTINSLEIFLKNKFENEEK